MKTVIRCALIGIISIFLQSCNKILSCKDAELGSARRENKSQKLRLDGYYYGSYPENTSKNPNIYVLFGNGVFLDQHSFDLDKAQSGNVDLTVVEIQKQHKGDWGVYKLDSTSIEIRSWIPEANRCVVLYIEKGNVLNDTTFEITSTQSSQNNEIRNTNALFRFVPYLPKPDSVVSFIP